MPDHAEKQNKPQPLAPVQTENFVPITSIDGLGRIGTAISLPPPLTPRNILRLQSLIGNQAVQRLLNPTVHIQRDNPDGGVPMPRDAGPIAGVPMGPQCVPQPGLTPQVILNRIQARARTLAQQPMAIDPDSMFYRRLRDHYLREYLQNPSQQTGQQAIQGIGRQMQGRMNPNDSSSQEALIQVPGAGERRSRDRWEVGAIGAWNRQPIPQVPNTPLFQNLSGLPRQLSAATDVLRGENARELPYIDTPFLLGRPNRSRGQDADVTGGGQNISQLMHWGTGVANARHGEAAMRELFLLYEMWHLEGWDVFGEDSINDLIAEEQGRLLGAELAQGERGSIRDAASLEQFINRSFRQSRAWVGTLLRQRQAQLDNWIRTPSQSQPNASFHWNPNDQRNVWHGRSTVSRMIATCMTEDEIMNSSMVQAQISIYRLIYESELWERNHGAIQLTELQRRILAGDLDNLMRDVNRMERGEWATGDVAHDLRQLGVQTPTPGS